MASSDLLTLQDVRVRDAYRRTGECRDLGSDPALWHRRMLEGLCQLIGVPLATGGEGLWGPACGPLSQALQHVPGGAVTVIALHRAPGERDFSPRRQRLLRQTLACLVEGDSERQVADRLDLSYATTHQYVPALYRHLGVRSRTSSWPTVKASTPEEIGGTHLVPS
jgi:hypothetical protein